MNDAAVLELVEHVARFARPRETRETGAAGADTPGRNRHRELGRAGGHRLDVDPAPSKLAAKRRIILSKRAFGLAILLGDKIR